MKDKKKTRVRQWGIILIFILFILVSHLMNFKTGMEIGKNSMGFIKSMLTLFPGALILIGLFEVWVDQKIVERHLGEQSRWTAYLWAILLACTIMAPLIFALPLAHSLGKKGARLSVVLTFLSASTVCRIPMTVFEAAYMGLAFSMVRLLVSIPLVILFSILIARMAECRKLRYTSGRD